MEGHRRAPTRHARPPRKQLWGKDRRGKGRADYFVPETTLRGLLRADSQFKPGLAGLRQKASVLRGTWLAMISSGDFDEGTRVPIYVNACHEARRIEV